MSLGVCGSYLVFISSTLVELTGWPRDVNGGNVSSEDAAQWVMLLLPVIDIQIECEIDIPTLTSYHGVGPDFGPEF